MLDQMQEEPEAPVSGVGMLESPEGPHDDVGQQKDRQDTQNDHQQNKWLQLPSTATSEESSDPVHPSVLIPPTKSRPKRIRVPNV